MAQPLLQDDGRNAGFNTSCGKGMPERMLSVAFNAALVAGSFVIGITGAKIQRRTTML